jgi:hypothetical protein
MVKLPIMIDRGICLQPGYLKELLPDTAPSKPDTLEALFDGNIVSFCSTFK